MSAFSHSSDAQLRVGDHVMTKQRHQSVVSGASRKGRSKKAQSMPITKRNPQPVANSPTALEFEADTSSMQAWWQTMTKGTWLSQTAQEIVIGVVKSVDVGRGTADVTVWKKGDKLTADAKFKPVETLEISRLEKLSLAQFNQICRKEFIHSMNYQLKLRGEGYDESAPFALIAHNNRIISSLIDRIDTSANLTTKDLKRHRPKGPGALKSQPTPSLVPVEDPLADVRGELQALAAGGLMSKRNKTGSKKEEVVKIDENVITPPLNQSSGFNVHDASGASHTEDTLIGEGILTQQRLSQKLQNVQAHVLQHSRGAIPLARTFYKQFGVHQTGLSDKHLSCKLLHVFENGTFVLQPSIDIPPFTASVVSVKAFVDKGTDEDVLPSAADRLRELVGSTVEVKLVAPDANGTAIVHAVYDGEPLQELLVREGLAVVSEDIYDNATTILGKDSAYALNCVGETKKDLQRLQQAQQKAFNNKVGRWSSAQAQSNFLPLHEPSTEVVTKGLSVDVCEEEGAAMPSLFTMYESSLAFQNRLLTATAKKSSD